MTPGPRHGCSTAGCRHTRPKLMGDNIWTQWHCPACAKRRTGSRRYSGTYPSVVYQAQREGISIGEMCRRLRGRGRPMGDRS